MFAREVISFFLRFLGPRAIFACRLILFVLFYFIFKYNASVHGASPCISWHIIIAYEPCLSAYSLSGNYVYCLLIWDVHINIRRIANQATPECIFFNAYHPFIFLAVQDSSIGDLVSESLSDTPFDFRAV